MNEIKRFDTNQRMSKVVVYGGLHIFCGQTATNREEGIEKQTQEVLEKIDNLLNQHGMDRKNLLQATIFVRDTKDVAKMNEVWDSWVPKGHAPARACMEARGVADNILVEILPMAGK